MPKKRAKKKKIEQNLVQEVEPNVVQKKQKVETKQSAFNMAVTSEKNVPVLWQVFGIDFNSTEWQFSIKGEQLIEIIIDKECAEKADYYSLKFYSKEQHFNLFVYTFADDATPQHLDEISFYFKDSRQLIVFVLLNVPAHHLNGIKHIFQRGKGKYWFLHFDMARKLLIMTSKSDIQIKVPGQNVNDENLKSTYELGRAFQKFDEKRRKQHGYGTRINENDEKKSSSFLEIWKDMRTCIDEIRQRSEKENSTQHGASTSKSN